VEKGRADKCRTTDLTKTDAEGKEEKDRKKEKCRRTDRKEERQHKRKRQQVRTFFRSSASCPVFFRSRKNSKQAALRLGRK
jgi:hypothetical protein